MAGTDKYEGQKLYEADDEGVDLFYHNLSHNEGSGSSVDTNEVGRTALDNFDVRFSDAIGEMGSD